MRSVAWDVQIEEDLRGGASRSSGPQAEADIAAGRTNRLMKSSTSPRASNPEVVSSSQFDCLNGWAAVEQFSCNGFHDRHVHGITESLKCSRSRRRNLVLIWEALEPEPFCPRQEATFRSEQRNLRAGHRNQRRACRITLNSQPRRPKLQHVFP